MKTRRWVAGLAVCTALSAASTLSGQVIRTGFDGNTLAANDDGSTAAVNMGFVANFFGSTHSQLFVNNNGNITFDSQLSTYTPFNLSTTSRQIIAPFFGDVDTRGAGSNLVTYGTGAVGGQNAFGVNWLGVGYFSARTDKLNSFQLVIIDRSDINAGDFDFEFNYGSIQWETGEASGGINGMGGSPARAGWSNGSTHTFELPGSAMSGAFVDGGPYALNGERWLFEVRNGQVINPPTSTVPEPMSMALLATGLLGVAVVRRRRRNQI